MVEYLPHRDPLLNMQPVTQWQNLVHCVEFGFCEAG